MKSGIYWNNSTESYELYINGKVILSSYERQTCVDYAVDLGLKHLTYR
jgi:hypothetical protein